MFWRNAVPARLRVRLPADPLGRARARGPHGHDHCDDALPMAEGDDHRARGRGRAVPASRSHESDDRPSRSGRAERAEARPRRARRPARRPGPRPRAHLVHPAGRLHSTVERGQELRRDCWRHALQQSLLLRVPERLGPVASRARPAEGHSPRRGARRSDVGRARLALPGLAADRGAELAPREPLPPLMVLPARADSPNRGPVHLRTPRAPHRVVLPVSRQRRARSRPYHGPDAQGRAADAEAGARAPLPRDGRHPLLTLRSRRDPRRVLADRGLRGHGRQLAPHCP